MARVEVEKGINRRYILKAIRKAQQTISLPKTTEIYVLKKKESCESIKESLHPHLQEEFTKSCVTERKSFSLHHQKRKIIVIQCYQKPYLLRDQKALIGLLLHEATHLTQAQQRLYHELTEIITDTARVYRKKFEALRYPKKKVATLIESLQGIVLLLMKDLHTNASIIEKGAGEYLLAYYQKELQGKKVCPRPVFYDKFKEAAQKNLDVITIAFEFEFALLSVILPFKKYKEEKAEILMKSIKECYEINIQEIARKCHELIAMYMLWYAPNSKFQRMFVQMIFKKVYTLLA